MLSRTNSNKASNLITTVLSRIDCVIPSPTSMHSTLGRSCCIDLFSSKCLAFLFCFVSSVYTPWTLWCSFTYFCRLYKWSYIVHIRNEKILLTVIATPRIKQSMVRPPREDIGNFI